MFKTLSAVAALVVASILVLPTVSLADVRPAQIVHVA